MIYTPPKDFVGNFTEVLSVISTDLEYLAITEDFNIQNCKGCLFEILIEAACESAHTQSCHADKTSLCQKGI